MSEMKSQLRKSNGKLVDITARPIEKLSQAERDKKVADQFAANLKDASPDSTAKK